METIGFIGLGNMGGPVAGHIQQTGFPMVVYDLRADAMKPFLERGATAAHSAAELARQSDVIISALPMPADVEKVACGDGGVLQGIRAKSIYIDISTSPPALIRKLEPLFRAKGAFVLDAPVASGQPGAARGIHEVMVGAAPEVFERAKPVLSAFGDQVIHAGPLGSGSICKLVHQMINSTIAQSISEGLTLGVKAGVDTKALWECVRRGMVGRMHVLHVQVPQNVFTGNYETDTFPLKLLRKDVGLATALGRALNVPLPLASINEQNLVEAINHGWENLSAYTVGFQLQEEAAQVKLRAEVDAEYAAKYIATNPNLEVL
ncbi:MAG: NAD(P)-dependent oxidoreductase [Deltaproteobacteria bacterium]|nr:NAD(P)-dependent oxidoreductase [Deltaproteobacteria bacterium]